MAETLGLPIKVVGGEVLGGTVKGAKGLVDAVRSVEELSNRRSKEGDNDFQRSWCSNRHE